MDQPSPVPDTEISLTFVKGLEVLRAFENGQTDMTVADIARLVGHTRAATRRLVRTLEVLGYVRSIDQRYRLTARALKLGLGFLQSRSIGHLVGPVLRAESIVIGESISLALLDADEAIYVFHNPADKSAEMSGHTIGSSMSLARTATGQAICAFLPEIRQQTGLATSGLSETEAAYVAKGLTDVHSQGFALRDVSPQSDLRALGVPAFNVNGQIAGALSIVFPTSRYSMTQIQKDLVPHLQRCATYLVSAL